MKKPMRTLLTLAALVLMVALLSFNWMRHESSARQKLDSLLGQTSEPLPQIQDAQAFPDWFNDSSPFGFPMPKSGVEIQETPQAYILHISIADPKDADQVQVNVSPNRIEVSGQTGSKQGNMQSTSSFFQSFSTSQPVIPEKMSRKIEKNGSQDQLVITIPKGSGQKQNSEENLPPLQHLPSVKQLDELERNRLLENQPRQVI